MKFKINYTNKYNSGYAPSFFVLPFRFCSEKAAAKYLIKHQTLSASNYKYKVEIAVSDLNTLQRAAINSFSTVTSTYYKNYIKSVTDQLAETKIKFYEILAEHDEE
jgi:hypothetical protein